MNAMAMIKCSECGKEVSDRSDKCISCGAPVGKTPDVQTIEATAKKWKMVQIAGMIILIIGIFSCSAATVRSDGSYGIGTTIPWIGLVVFLFGRIAAWWHHG